MEVTKSFARWIERAKEDAQLVQELLVLKQNDDQPGIQDRFYRELEFGTGGLRGTLGAGSNRMNIYTVRKATQGLADYLNAAGLVEKVAIAYDSRIKSDLFAREAARVLAANGITAWLYPRLQPTPALSWAVRYLGCSAGICITASHNPAEYNGYKVYGADGCQITLAAAEDILRRIGTIDCFDGVKVADFSTALAEGAIRYIPEECLSRFIDAVYAQRVDSKVDMTKLKLVYTPLNGSGLECVQRLLEKLGVREVAVVPEQEKPDGRFPTCPYPNPEIREAMQKGLELCERIKPDLLLGTDPDCDRCGAAARNAKGEYQLITGNEMGALLLDYICRARTAAGSMPQNPVAITTIVSTDLATPIAQKYGVELRRTLTGFKFIGEQISQLENAGQTERFLFGFEESYGYLSGSHVRDKDAVNAALLVCEAAAWYAKQGKTLLEAVQALYEEFGFYRNALCSFTFEGESGMKAMQQKMQKLRQAPPLCIGDLAVDQIVDYKAEGTGLPQADVLEYRLAGGAKFMVRPSGTEPKMKVYLSAMGKTREEADETNRRLERAATAMLAEKEDLKS